MQYVRFLTRIARGDLGRSIINNQQVSTMIRAQVGSTVQLTIAGIATAILIGVPLGIIAARTPQ